MEPNIYAYSVVHRVVHYLITNLFYDTYIHNLLQAWIIEMAAYVKSVDRNHLLEVGLEGFYGESMHERKQYNPGYEVGTDFISNNHIAGIDFTTIHLYADQW